ncbi:glycoside hydrolase family 3, partial [Micromonospora wenchangensis]
MPISPRRAGVAVTALTALLASGCAGEGQAPAPVRPEATPTATATAADDPAGRAAALAGTLGDEDLVGQVLMPYAYGSSATTVTPGSAAGNQALAGVDTPAEMIAKYRLGGLILVG